MTAIVTTGLWVKFVYSLVIFNNLTICVVYVYGINIDNRLHASVLSASLCASHTCSAMALRALALVALFQGATALELTESNWDAETAGKSVFVKFLAPW